MQPEIFPAEVSFRNPWTRLEIQGSVLSCTRFGLTSALEAIAHHAGVNVQLSPRYLWYYRNPQSLSVQEVVGTVNRVGVCREELCPYEASLQPPYAVKDIDVPPSGAAFADAQAWLDSSPDVLVKRIAGKWECARALAKGSALMYFNPTSRLWERWENVSLSNPSVDIVSFTKV